MSERENLRQQFAEIRRRETGQSTKSGKVTNPNEQEQDMTEAGPISQGIEMISKTRSEAMEHDPEVEPDGVDDASKRSGEAMSLSLTVAQTEQQNNINDLENIRKRIRLWAVTRGWSPIIPVHQKLIRQARARPKPVQVSQDVTAAIEALSFKVCNQDEIIRNLGEASDKHAADNKALTKMVDETSVKVSNSKAISVTQNLLLAQLQGELKVNQAKFDALQAYSNRKAVELISKDETVEQLQKQLRNTNRKLRECEAARVVAPPMSRSLDAARIQSIRLKDSAADKEEIKNLKSKSLALEKELHEAKVQVKQENSKAKQIAKQHGDEIAKLINDNDDLVIEKVFMETELKSVKESFTIQLEEMETLVKKLRLELIESKGNFRSWLRIRPPQGTLIKQPISIRGGDKVEVIDRFGNTRDFQFDRVFAPEANNASVFHDLSEILEAALQGYDITVLAYGQTGSGKTYTMSAMLDMALEKIFTQLGKSYGTDYSVKGRCIEVYEHKVYDLFKPVREPQKVSSECGGMWPVREQVLPVQTTVLDNLESIQAMIKDVNKNRTSGQTEKNDTSSRSHMFLSFQIKASKTEPSGAITTTRSGITFIDLAGSESLKNVTGRQTETQAINSELSALKSVLIAMGNNAARIPFRDTQLTRLLQDGFTGGKVLFIQAASLGELEESIHTMDFGSLVSKITQKRPAKNVVTEFAATEGGLGETTVTSLTPAAGASTRVAAKDAASTRGAPATRGSHGPRGNTRDRERGK
ncbi:aed85090-78a9-4b9c-9c72-4a947067508a-CDS [Sclerotinia trifoliorum]|uniref:Aed85090-78a9-4b9c-9c72-4a947067508a-CDS n=1 Tax=Sclerotinia trifoliorum TaxID=28548 RepID=A0A8H2W276_9HELO|nr:aed85090-78a9-4b9c-9c72-4a947067508a-CDS [Sclerotinia trifoliorum]